MLSETRSERLALSVFRAEAKGQSGLSEADREQLAAAQARLKQVAAAAGGTQNPQATAASSQSLGMAETAERERTAEVAEVPSPLCPPPLPPGPVSLDALACLVPTPCPRAIR